MSLFQNIQSISLYKMKSIAKWETLDNWGEIIFTWKHKKKNPPKIIITELRPFFESIIRLCYS